MSLTVHMFAKDGSPLPGFSPLQHAIAATHDAVRFDTATLASHRPGYRHPTNDAGTRDAAITARNAAYEIYEASITDAWKSNTGIGSFRGAPVAGSYPVGPGCREGGECTNNGAEGVLVAVDGHPGWLECRAADDNADHSNDSIQHDAANAQAIKDSAYAEYDLRIQKSWRKQS